MKDLMKTMVRSAVNNEPIKKRLVSERGIELMDQDPISTPLITVEKYEKWYNLYVISPRGEVQTISPELISHLSTAKVSWIDHLFHPILVQRVALALKGEVSPVTLEVITGRWALSRNLFEDAGYFLDEEEEDEVLKLMEQFNGR